jgi:hypothetical protein
MLPVKSSSRFLGWRSAASRMGVHWIAKMVGTTAGMAAFFVAYFHLLNHPAFPVTTMPLLALDRWISFRPAALVLYVSLWIYVPLAPALLTSWRELWSYAAATFVLSALGLGIFFFWPTVVPQFGEVGDTPGLVLLQGIDAAGNACPSLHVAFAVFTAVWFDRILRQLSAGPGLRIGNALWAVAIVYSTMALRQHVALDVFAGAALGAAVVAGHLAWLDRPRAGQVSAAMNSQR